MLEAENCELYAVAGRSLEKAEAFKNEFGFEKAYGDYESLLADPEVKAVYIPLPNHLHLEWIKKAAEAGKHVLCEKPMCLNVEELKEAFDTCKKNNVTIILSHVNEQPYKTMEKGGFIEKIGAENFCAHIDDALARFDRVFSNIAVVEG